MRVRCGSAVKRGDPLCTLYVNDGRYVDEARALLTESIVISPQRGTPTPMVYDIIRSARA